MFWQLSDACSAAAGALEERRPRTREEREAFAQQLRFLLLVVVSRLSTGRTIPGSPEQALAVNEAISVADAFSVWHRLACREALRSMRHHTLWKAADFVLGRDANRWLDPHDVLWNRRRSYLGVGTEGALAVTLQELEAVRTERVKGTRQVEDSGVPPLGRTNLPSILICCDAATINDPDYPSVAVSADEGLASPLSEVDRHKRSR